jgi:uncharacterized phage-associated protein
MTTATAVAEHLIRLAAADPEGKPMTAMRLQKLPYYCQGWYLAWYGRPLFADPIEAWRHGPVVPSEYNRLRASGRDPLPVPTGTSDLPADARRAIERVWSFYARYSTSGLRDLTHAERPWRDHYHPDTAGRCNESIPPDDMAAFFGDEYRKATGDEPGSEAAVEADVAAGRLTPADRALEELGW